MIRASIPQAGPSLRYLAATAIVLFLLEAPGADRATALDLLAAFSLMLVAGILMKPDIVDAAVELLRLHVEWLNVASFMQRFAPNRHYAVLPAANLA